MKNIIWRAHIECALTVDNYCKGCKMKASFVSSGLFRVNAQKKSLDVWLIYKCSICDTTWNLTVLSRVNPSSIHPETLRKFLANDSALALHYATDIPLIKKNGGEPGCPIVEIEGERVDMKEPVRIQLIAEQPVGIKVLTILRNQLGLSRSEINRLYDSGRIRCVSGQEIKKYKLTGEIVIEIE
ncbi:MAG: DUF1062 domain-containing protein [Oscillospiraceae bacterium]|nr:DUF1062 domain-containing protein [Oscillospiraceae bacterium]